MTNNKLVITLAIIIIGISACQYLAPNKLVGHTYIIQPVSAALAMRLMAGLTTIIHEYEDNSTVKVVSYLGTTPIKSEELTYSFNGSTYRINNEIYDVTFRQDTVVYSINGCEFFDMIPVGKGKSSANRKDTGQADFQPIGGGSSIKIYHKKHSVSNK